MKQHVKALMISKSERSQNSSFLTVIPEREGSLMMLTPSNQKNKEGMFGSLDQRILEIKDHWRGKRN
jgi:hypothetical protein